MSQILEILMLCLSRSVTVTYSQWKILTFLVFGRSISVPCESLSMLGDPGTTGCDGVRFQDHSASAKNQMSEDFTYWSESIKYLSRYSRSSQIPLNTICFCWLASRFLKTILPFYFKFVKPDFAHVFCLLLMLYYSLLEGALSYILR